jgi:hypothetical protein
LKGKKGVEKNATAGNILEASYASERKMEIGGREEICERLGERG